MLPLTPPQGKTCATPPEGGLAIQALALGLIWCLTRSFFAEHGWRDAAWPGLLGLWLVLLGLDPAVRRIIRRWPRHIGWDLAGLGGVLLGWSFVAGEARRPGLLELAMAATAVLLGHAATLAWTKRQGPPVISRLFLATEACRWLVLGGVGLWLICPYITTTLVGGGDANHYLLQLADTIEQFRQGVFPVLIGQGSFAFNGDFHPLRTAPYFQYAGLLVDWLSFGRLGPATIQNLLISGSFLGAIASTYLSLRHLRPAWPWTACLLAIAFASSPGILALIYSGDMIASWMTLPWLPVIFASAVRAGEAENPRPALAALSGALALVWLAHAPIALWTSLLLVPALGLWVLAPGTTSARRFWIAAAAAGGCLCLSAYVFVSVQALQIEADPNLLIHFRGDGILANLKVGWSGLGRLIEPGASNLLPILQLSPALVIALLVALRGLSGAGPIHVSLLAGAVVLILLLTPTSFTANVWSWLPPALLNATDKWPMQRFHPILACLLPVLCLTVLTGTVFDRGRRRLYCLWALTACVLFSLVEARKFIARGQVVTLPSELLARRMRPESALLSRYSYEYFGSVPRYFKSSTVSPLMQNRLLSADTLELRLSNRHAFLGSHPTPLSIHGFVPTDFGGRFEPELPLQPGENYLLRAFLGPSPPHGTLQLIGNTVFREYELPVAGRPEAFNLEDPIRNAMTLWTTGAEPDSILARYYHASGEAPTSPASFLELYRIEPARLPLRLTRLMPFQLVADAPVSGWLETMKISVPGYRALVDGQPVRTATSPDGLLMLPVTEGRHRIDLTYPGPPLLAVSFWFTLSAWVAWILLSAGLHLWPAPAGRVFDRAGQLFTIAAGLAMAALVYFHFTAPRIPHEREPLVMEFNLPPDKFGQCQVLWSENTPGGWQLAVHLVGINDVRLVLFRGGETVAVSPMITANYYRRQELAVHFAAASAHNPVTSLWLNHRLISLQPPTRDPADQGLVPAPYTGRLSSVQNPAAPAR